MKRRRLNDSFSSALSKPFKSPVRRQPASSTMTTNASQEADETASASQSQGTIGTDTTQPDTHYPSTPENHEATKTKGPEGLSMHFPDMASAVATKPSPAVTARLTSLRKQESALLSRLVSLRRELDTMRQALRVEQTGQDVELERLVGKWTAVSRAAAEELFAAARDRVNRMGGVHVWQERVRDAKHRRMQNWEDDPLDGNDRDEDEDEDVVAEKERRRKELQDEVGGGEAGQDGKGNESEEEDAETFTMDMMLKSLNVDLNLIGFDKVNQRWID